MQADSTKASERGWRDLYLAALFEAEPSRLPDRIAEAEYALSVRDRELWYASGDHTREKQALTGAMRALEALRNIHECPRPVSSASRYGAEASSGNRWQSG